MQPLQKHELIEFLIARVVESSFKLDYGEWYSKWKGMRDDFKWWNHCTGYLKTQSAWKVDKLAKYEV